MARLEVVSRVGVRMLVELAHSVEEDAFARIRRFVETKRTFDFCGERHDRRGRPRRLARDMMLLEPAGLVDEPLEDALDRRGIERLWRELGPRFEHASLTLRIVDGEASSS